MLRIAVKKQEEDVVKFQEEVKATNGLLHSSFEECFNLKQDLRNAKESIKNLEN